MMDNRCCRRFIDMTDKQKMAKTLFNEVFLENDFVLEIWIVTPKQEWNQIQHLILKLNKQARTLKFSGKSHFLITISYSSIIYEVAPKKYIIEIWIEKSRPSFSSKCFSISKKTWRNSMHKMSRFFYSDFKSVAKCTQVIILFYG